MKTRSMFGLVPMLLGVIITLTGTVNAVASSGYGMWNWYLVPASGSLPGALGTYWRTDLAITNPYSWRAITVKVWFLQDSLDNSHAIPTSYTINPGSQVLLSDVVWNIFGVHSKGALLLDTADGAYFLTSARTYTGSGATYGQGVNGQSSLVGANGQAWITGVRNTSAFRTNLGVVNGSAVSISVLAEVLDDTGAVRGSTTFNLLAFSNAQASMASFTNQLNSGSVRFTCSTSTSSAQWVAYATVIDNATGDSTYLEERADDVYASVTPSCNLTGYWEGSIAGGAITEDIKANVYEDGAWVQMYVYDYSTGAYEFYGSGYETGCAATFYGSAKQWEVKGEHIWGTVSYANGYLTGTFTGTGPYAVGGTFSVRRISTSPFAVNPSETAREATHRASIQEPHAIE